MVFIVPRQVFFSFFFVCVARVAHRGEFVIKWATSGHVSNHDRTHSCLPTHHYAHAPDHRGRHNKQKEPPRAHATYRVITERHKLLSNCRRECGSRMPALHNILRRSLRIWSLGVWTGRFVCIADKCDVISQGPGNYTSLYIYFHLSLSLTPVGALFFYVCGFLV